MWRRGESLCPDLCPPDLCPDLCPDFCPDFCGDMVAFRSTFLRPLSQKRDSVPVPTSPHHYGVGSRSASIPKVVVLKFCFMQQSLSASTVVS